MALLVGIVVLLLAIVPALIPVQEQRTVPIPCPGDPTQICVTTVTDASYPYVPFSLVLFWIGILTIGGSAILGALERRASRQERR